MSNGFDSYVQEAQRLHANGDIDGALEMFKSALTEDPSQRGDPPRGHQPDPQKRRFPADHREYFDWAEACQENGAIDDAIRIYQEILGLDNPSPEKDIHDGPGRGRGNNRPGPGNIQAASGAIFFNLGYLYLEKGALDEAISCLQKAWSSPLRRQDSHPPGSGLHAERSGQGSHRRVSGGSAPLTGRSRLCLRDVRGNIHPQRQASSEYHHVVPQCRRPLHALPAVRGSHPGF